MKRTHIDLFDDNSWGWALTNALIQNGVLDIIAIGGNGDRSPDADWYSGSTDDFEIEFKWKLDDDTKFALYTRLYLVGDATPPLDFNVYGGTTDEMQILWYGVKKVSQAFIYTVGNWYTSKIRRVGTVYYFSINGGDEISWDYETERAIDYLKLYMGCTGEFDNFKYYPVEIGFTTGVGNPTIL